MNNKEKQGLNFSSVDLLIYIWNKKWILLIVSLVAAVSSIVISLQITEKFKSTVIMFPTTGASISKSLLSSNYTGRESVYGFGEEEQAEQMLQVLNSDQIRERIIEKYNLMDHYEIDTTDKYPLTELANEYKDNIKFRRTDLMSVEISVLDKDPQIAADIANNISDLIDTIYNEMKKDRANAAFNLVEQEYFKAELNYMAIQDTLQQVENSMSAALRNIDDASSTELIRVLAEGGGSFITLYRKMDHETSSLMNLRNRYKEARLESIQQLPHKFVVDRAYPSEKKTYPKRSVIVMVSTASAFLFTLILLIIIDSLQERIAIIKED